MPFDNKLNSLYERLKSICESLKVECRRADEVALGSITKQIIENIFYSDIVIADLTFSNPNVYYELAISHSIGNKTIMISQEEKIPFDIRQYHVIKYKDSIEGVKVLEGEIKRKLAIILNGGTIDNPIQMHLPKSKEEQRFDRLGDMNKEILIALAESRKMEMEIVANKLFWSDPNSMESVKSDLKKLTDLIEKIRKV
jgi:hypothetical protein